jgi:hypothetical protein
MFGTDLDEVLDDTHAGDTMSRKASSGDKTVYKSAGYGRNSEAGVALTHGHGAIRFLFPLHEFLWRTYWSNDYTHFSFLLPNIERY